MLNIERYKEEIIDDIDKRLNSIYGAVYTLLENLDIHFAEDDDTYDRRIAMINWLCEEYKEPILDDKEKEYLGNVIKPFKNNITYIRKYENYGCGTEHIYICLENKRGELESIGLPTFKKGTMYKGMDAEKRYTLEELGL